MMRAATSLRQGEPGGTIASKPGCASGAVMTANDPGAPTAGIVRGARPASARGLVGEAERGGAQRDARGHDAQRGEAVGERALRRRRRRSRGPAPPPRRRGRPRTTCRRARCAARRCPPACARTRRRRGSRPAGGRCPAAGAACRWSRRSGGSRRAAPRGRRRRSARRRRAAGPRGWRVKPWAMTTHGTGPGRSVGTVEPRGARVLAAGEGQVLAFAHRVDPSAAAAARPTRRRGGARPRAGRGARRRRRPRRPRGRAARWRRARRAAAPAKPSAATRSSSGRSRLARTVGAPGAGPSRSRSWRRACSADAVGRARCRASACDRLALVVDAEHRRPAQLRGGDGEHARAAADVDAARPAGSSSSSSSRHRRVVGCAPVPNACAGSMTTSTQAARAAAPTAGARTAAPTCTGRWNALQRSSQSSATSVVATSTSAPPAAARRSGSVGQLAGRAVDRVLDDVAVARAPPPRPARAPAARRARARRARAARAAPGGSSEQALELADAATRRCAGSRRSSSRPAPGPGGAGPCSAGAGRRR